MLGKTAVEIWATSSLEGIADEVLEGMELAAGENRLRTECRSVAPVAMGRTEVRCLLRKVCDGCKVGRGRIELQGAETEARGTMVAAGDFFGGEYDRSSDSSSSSSSSWLKLRSEHHRRCQRPGTRNSLMDSAIAHPFRYCSRTVRMVSNRA